MDNSVKNYIDTIRDEAMEKGIVASILYHHEKSHLMRIGNNSVSLSTSEELTRLDIEVTNGKKQGSHTQLGEVTSLEYLREALELTIKKAEVGKDKDYTPIIDEVEETIEQCDQFDEDLFSMNPEFKAKSYKAIIDEVGDKYNFSGSWSSGSTEYYFVSTANKNSVFRKGTDQAFNIVLKHPEKLWELNHVQSGWRKDQFSTNDTIEHFKRLLEVYENNDGFYVKPNEYKVMLGAEAIAELIGSAVWTGFSGEAYEEDRGWNAGKKFGDKVLSEKITLADDPSDDNTFKFKFDLSGRKREFFPFVEEGKFKNLIYGSTAAAKYNKKPTAHSVTGISLSLKTGDGEACPIEATKGMGKVLYIPALHYINMPNPNKGIFTGSSRFNALLIEDGKVISPIFSSRITDSFGAVFGNVLKVSGKSVSMNQSNTYGRRSPVATSVPSYIISENIKITDCAKSF
ncbi:MAG: hypothetical protein CR982_09030 [Candidatus Cloacimonadota bacterium]|nr:MAG: hypothetical protein CR982_09030 [Candidatus Cloacimonadota bacterium]PIE78609.1 MAG: hypothetical protein CSA15_06925 [Candidatus Delongbacteria bacterium]